MDLMVEPLNIGQLLGVTFLGAGLFSRLRRQLPHVTLAGSVVPRIGLWWGA
jgi:hypothetical protein